MLLFTDFATMLEIAVRPFVFSETGGEKRPIGSLLTYQAERDPDRPAVTIDDQTMTRSALDKAANRMARALADLGVEEGDFVMIAMPNSFQFHILCFALWKLGATPAPVSDRLPALERDAIAELVAPRLIFGLPSPTIAADRCLPADFAPDAELPDTPLEDRVPRIFKATTSGGSTGRPKVIVDQSPAVFDADSRGLGMLPDDVVLSPGPLYHNGPFGLSHRALSRGAHVVEMTRFDPEGALALIERHRIRWLYLVPTMMSRIWNLPQAVRERYDLSSVEMVVHMAAPCPPWLKEAWIRWFGPEKIWEVYSGSERCGATAIGGEDWLTHRGSVGRPVNAEIRILAENGEEARLGAVGEIYFRANLPGSRYIGADARVQDGWSSYGDLGSVDADGFLYIADRRTDLIISGGANIYPAEIEAALDAHPGVASSVVVGLSHPDLGQSVHAIVQQAPGHAVANEDLAGHLRERLVSYKLPRTVEVVSSPLRDDAGKVRRSAMRADREKLLEDGVQFDRLRR